MKKYQEQAINSKISYRIISQLSSLSIEIGNQALQTVAVVEVIEGFKYSPKFRISSWEVLLLFEKWLMRGSHSSIELNSNSGTEHYVEPLTRRAPHEHILKVPIEVA